MPITIENDHEVIVYALVQLIAFPRRTQQIFIGPCVWCLVLIIGLEEGLLVLINNLCTREENVVRKSVEVIPDNTELSEHISIPREIYPCRRGQIIKTQEVSATPRDPAVDQ
jgi:hypothetical protein